MVNKLIEEPKMWRETTATDIVYHKMPSFTIIHSHSTPQKQYIPTEIHIYTPF